MNLVCRKHHDGKHLCNSQALQTGCDCRLIVRERYGDHGLSLHQRLKDRVWSTMRDDHLREPQNFQLRDVLRHQWIAWKIGEHFRIEAPA